MNRTLKLAVPLLLLVVLCTTLSGASAQQAAIKADDGGDLPDSILIGDTFTVLITEDGSPVGAGTNVVFTLPQDGGNHVYVQTDDSGKARYKPLLTGTLGIRVLDGLVTAAEATVAVEEFAVEIKAEDGGDLPDSIPVGETFTVLITDGGSHVGAGTNVVFTFPATGGTPIYVPTDGDGKARYKPLLTGTLGIRVLDGTVTVAEATVTVADGVSELPALTSVDISPETADLVIGGTQQFTAVCNDTSGGTVTDDCTLAWSCDRPLVGMIDSSSGLFTAVGVGTATVTVSATYNGVTKIDSAVVDVSGSTEPIDVGGDNFTESPIDAGTAVINMSGEFNNIVTGNINVTPVADPEAVAGYAFTGDDQVLLIGLNVTPNATIRDELDNGGDTIRIEICYNATEIERLKIDPATLAIWRYDGSTWVEMVNRTPPCIGNGRYGTCVWVELDNLTVFALVGTLQSQPGGSTSSSSGGGSGGTYPPGWGDAPTPAATPAPTDAAPEPTVAPAEAPTVASTKAPTKAPTAAPTEIETTKVQTKGTPGFGAALAVFAIAGLLVAAYLVMRRRE